MIKALIVNDDRLNCRCIVYTVGFECDGAIGKLREFVCAFVLRHRKVDYIALLVTCENQRAHNSGIALWCFFANLMNDATTLVVHPSADATLAALTLCCVEQNIVLERNHHVAYLNACCIEP